MPIDPDKLRGGNQINVRVSDDAQEVIDYLKFVDRHDSRGAWLLYWVGAVIETEAPHIRKELEKPEAAQHHERINKALEALDRLSPPEE